MLTVVAFVLIVGFFGTGPFFVGAQATCSGDNNSNSNSRSERTISKCDLEQVQKMMRGKKVPKELKVEVDGKLYSVPEAVEMITPSYPKTREKWWKRVARKARVLSRGAAADAGNSNGDHVDNTGDGGDEDGESNASNLNDNGSSDDSLDDITDAQHSEPAKNETMSAIDLSDASEATTEAAVAAEKDMRPAGEHSCQICFDHDHSTVMLPCGHGGLCWDCGLQIYALTEECPMCRSRIELLIPLDGKKRRYEGEHQLVSSAGFGKDGAPLVAFHKRVVQ